jgi:hypothetical protein
MLEVVVKCKNSEARMVVLCMVVVMVVVQYMEVEVAVN